MFILDDSGLFGPSPDVIYPVKGNKSIIFLKNIITKSRIKVGDFTTFTPLKEEDNQFEKDNVLYYSEALNDYLIIGKFCHISSNVKFMMNAANHTYTNFTTYGFGFLGSGWCSDSNKDACRKLGYPSDHQMKGDIVIGNAVWLGYDSLILPGVTIGDGAIIGARSVVTKDVPPYTIVAGNPAREIKKLFSSEVINCLLKLKWWDLPTEIISKNIQIISGNDFSKLQDLYLRVRGAKK